MQQNERDNLIKENMKLVHFVLNKFFPSYKRDEDLTQCGMIGLIKAVDSYNPELSKFSTYAVRHIKNEMLNEIRRRNTSEKMLSKALSLDAVVRTYDGDTTFGELMVGEADVPYIDLDEFYKNLTEVERLHFDLLKKGCKQTDIMKLTGHSRQNTSAIIRHLKLKWRKYIDGNFD